MLEQEAGRTSRAGRNARRENRITSAADSDYGSDPFEGLTGQELDALEQAAESDNTTAGSTPANRGDDLRPKIQSLQDQMFRKLFPASGFETSPKDKTLASASDRFQAASEILHDRGSEFGHDILSLINNMPPGPEQIKSIQKLSPVFQNFSIETTIDLLKSAENYLYNDPDGTFEEKVDVQKFMTIARDYLSEYKCDFHQQFSDSKNNQTLVKTAQKELDDDFRSDIDLRNPLDNQLLKSDFEAIVNLVERYSSPADDLVPLTKHEALEIRQSAYLLRGVVARLDYSRSEAPAAKEHTAGLTSVTQDDGARRMATSLRLELRDAHRERSPHSR